MKKIIIFLMVLVPHFIYAQTTNTGNVGHYDVLTFIGNPGFGNSGFTITTTIPSTEKHNTIIYIKGFDNVSRTIGLQISWFYSGGSFYNTSASSTGGFMPESITLDNQGSYIKIHINEYSDEQNIELTAYADVNNFDPSWFTNWTMDDGGGDGEYVQVINRFGEVYTQNLYSSGLVSGSTGSITNDLNVGWGNVNGGINTTNITVSNKAKIYGSMSIGPVVTNSAPLHTIGGVRFQSLGHTNSDKVLSTDANGNLILVNKGGFWQTHTNTTTNPNTIGYAGNVYIGTNPSTLTLAENNYKLVVGGTIGATKVKVTQSGWADYVFYDNYKLQPLTEIEKFVKVNKHLEGVPTEKEVKENGVDLGETQVILLKKIEELTLHLIELNKKLEHQNSQIKALNKKVIKVHNR
jgi:hypothetical protein